MNEGRRESDHRFSKLEDKIDKLNTDRAEFKTKIIHTDNTVSKLDVRNEKEHGELKFSIDHLGKQVTGLAWKIAFGSFGIVLTQIILRTLLGD